MRRFCVCTATLLLGCVGDIGGGDDSVVDDGPTSDPQSCTEGRATPMRRLSRTEYEASVRALFPGIDVGLVEVARDPIDDGFENRADLLNPQPALIEQYSDVAAEVAARVIRSPSLILPCSEADIGAQACAGQFIAVFGERVFRRPLTADESSTYEAFFAKEMAAGANFIGATQLMIEALLQSPQFLYRLEFGAEAVPQSNALRASSFEVASRLSYLIWGSGPDDVLLEKAKKNQLESADAREVEARRMLADPRAASMLISFHRQWLDFDRLFDEAKDPATYASYDAALQASIREESDRFISNVMWSGEGTVSALLTSTETEVDASLASLYGIAVPASGWEKTSLDPRERAGILTRANFLAARAHKLTGSPPLRAVFVLEKLLCQSIGAPPADADLSEPAISNSGDDRTNRSLFEERTSPEKCSGCHSAFDPLGFAFEHYDAIGQYRTLDAGEQVDASGKFASGEGEWAFNDGVDLSQKLAESKAVERCVAEKWFEYAYGREAEEFDSCRLEALEASFDGSGGDIRELLVSMVRDEDFVLLEKATP
jgi:hypothetical protein